MAYTARARPIIEEKVKARTKASRWRAKEHLNMRDFPKKVKRLLREQAALAYEEELRRALLPLAAAFDEWKAGKIKSGELDAMIHDFHQGLSRKLFSNYNDCPLDIVIAHAIGTGILDKSQVPPELLDHLSRAIAFYENQETSS